MKLWIDDLRPAPAGYTWCKTVNEARDEIIFAETKLGIVDYEGGMELCQPSLYNKIRIEIIDMDHDAGEYASQGGDYIKLLDYLETTGRNYPIRIHSMNPVGVQNMRAIIQRNGWTEIR